MISLPPVPPVMVQGQSVTFTGQGAADARVLLQLGLEQLRGQALRTGVGVPERWERLLFAAEKASADMRTSSDVRENPTPASSASDRLVGVDEVARLFDVGDRQARRIIQQAGGTRTRKGWRIPKRMLRAEYELRRSA